ncbi:Transcriptional regulator, AraC family [Fulvivirga imtechensis AK7]|uniref:Transcriptional regulator, AraC family n=2 Tax=Fulvivirga TaxID=396811 RepID=L8JN02_9BACT|nr:Transcriptional regulator, AraC family [Fulvivirga imtechensis AK7]
MLTPGDSHSFSTMRYTKFHCIRFLPELFTQENNDTRSIFYQLKESISYHNRLSGMPLESLDERPLVIALIEQVLKESSLRSQQHELIIKSSIGLILQFLLRSVGRGRHDGGYGLSTNLTIDNMLNYVRFNITDNAKLTKKVMASFFNISPHYIGEYFKKHCGMSLRDYIVKCKLSHIERKMLNNNLSISQIAVELGFVDESHLCKFVKRCTGQSPTNYRKKLE